MVSNSAFVKTEKTNKKARQSTEQKQQYDGKKWVRHDNKRKQES